MNKSSVRGRDLEEKSKRACDGVNKTIHMIANEPSMGLYRIQQHIHKSVPKFVACQKLMDENNEQLKLMTYNISEATNLLAEIKKTSDTFDQIEEKLKRAVASAALLNMNQNLKLQNRNKMHDSAD